MPVKTATATLITVAPTGAEVQKAAVPALPVTLDELVTTAIPSCVSMIHLELRFVSSAVLAGQRKAAPARTPKNVRVRCE